MNAEIASLRERMAQGGSWADFQREIAALHERATTEAEYVTVLEAHRNLVAVGEQVFDAAKYAELLPIAESEYLMFLNAEAMEDGFINPVLLDRITKREIAAGRLDPNSEIAKLASAGAAVLGDSAEITAHRCRKGDFLFYGAAAAVLLSIGAAQVGVSPLLLIPVALLAGWFVNERERKRITDEIAARRVSGDEL